MSKRRWFVPGVLLVLALFTAACGPATPLPKATVTPRITTASAAVSSPPQATATPGNLALVEVSPRPPAALPRNGALTFTFNLPLNTQAARRAFRLADATGATVAGQVDFPNDRTLRFTPAHPLQPESAYTAVFTTALQAANGLRLTAPLRFDYTTEAAFAVLRVFPAEDSRDVPLNADITIVFNKPVVPLTAREEAEAAPLPLAFHPAIQGSGRWISSAIYTFHPSKPLASNTTYTVSLPAGVRTFQGETISQAVTWAFHTYSARVLDAQADNTRLSATEPAHYIRLDAALQIHFSQPMDRQSAEAAIQLTGANAAPVPPFTFRWNQEATRLTLIPKALYQAGEIYTLIINENARAQDGGTLARTYHYTFQTAGIPRLLSSDPRNGRTQTNFSPQILLTFNTYPDPKAAAHFIRISPQPASFRVSAYGRYLQVGQLEAGTRYTITLLPGLPDLFGHTLQKPETLTITTAHLQPEARLLLPPDEAAVLRADGPRTLWLRYANVDDITLSLYQVSDEALLHALADYDNHCPTAGKPLAVWHPSKITTAQRDREHFLQFTLDDLTGGASLPPQAYCLRLHSNPMPPYTSDQTAWLLLATDNLTLESAPTSGLVWATDLATGTPQGSLPIQLFGIDHDENDALRAFPQETTDKDGVAAWPTLPEAPRFALLHTANRFAFVDDTWGSNPDEHYTASYWSVSYPPPSTTALIYTDRPLYRPGQPIYFKGIVRHVNDLNYTLSRATSVWVALYHEGKVYAEQHLSLSAWGTFHGTVMLAENAPVGEYSWEIRLKHNGDPIGWGAIRVAAYHKPVFEVRLTPQTRSLLPGGRTTVQLEADYYAGDRVAHGQVQWNVDRSPYTFQPPKAFEDYIFGETTFAWWNFASQQEHTTPSEANPQSGKAVTDAQGRADIPIEAPIGLAQGDTRLTLWASVTDAGGNTADGHTDIIVRKSNIYVGLKTHGWVGIAGQPLTVDLVVLDPQGNPVPNQPLRVVVEEERWHSVQQRDASGILRWKSTLETAPVTTFDNLTTDGRGGSQIVFTAGHSGTYRFTAETRDANGRLRKAVLRVWVAGKSALLWARDEHSLPIIPDRRAYRPGDTAHILVPQPFGAPSYALMTVARGHIFTYRVVHLDQPNALLDVPLTGNMAPSVYVSVLSVRGAGKNSPPSFRSGTIYLPVALDEQTVQITLTPDRDHLAPGDTVHFTIETRTHEGNPVPAEVSLALVDKAVLALAPDTFSLMRRLYPPLSLAVAPALSLVNDVEAYNARIQRLLPSGEGMGSGGGGKGSDLGGVITVRSAFRDTAYWRADVHTDTQGRAEVSIPLPDNMTTWVLRARAITPATRVGTATAEITVNRPFFVRLHIPAFFTGGDQPIIQAVVHNATNATLQAAVRLKAKGLTLKSPAEQTVQVPAKGQAVVTWQASVPLTSTRADLEVEAHAGAYQDASRPVLTTLPDGGIPVEQFTTNETVGTAGVLPQAGEIRETILPPAQAPHFNLRLEITASLTAGLGQALTYDKPPKSKCTYSQAGSLLANAAAAQAFQALQTHPAWQSQLDEAVQHAIQTLEAAQSIHGGWGWCPEGQAAPLPTAYAAFALIQAREAGYTVDNDTLRAAGSFLRRALHNPKINLSLESRAFAIDVLARMKYSDAASQAYALDQAAQVRGMSMAGWALLLDAAKRVGAQTGFTAPLVQRLENAVVLSAASARWDGSTGSWWMWDSDTATTALAVNALLLADPHAPFLPQAIRWLMNRRQAGRWPGDQDTAAAVLALANWVRATGESTPAYQGAVFLDGQRLAAFQMDTPQAALTPKTFTWNEKSLTPGQPHELTIQRNSGHGMLYYDAYLESTLLAASVPARADGITVSRAYYLLNDLNTPVTTMPVGAMVQVRLNLIVPHDLHHVVLTDYLPAGLEALAPQGAESPGGGVFSPEDFQRYGWGGWYFYHREAYDDRVVFTADDLPAGVYTIVYDARAAVRGTFQARPAEAHEAFFPDMSGRSAGMEIRVK